MRKFVVSILVCLLATVAASAATKKKKHMVKSKTASKASCPKTLANCPPEGCGTDFDPNLNRRKNIIPTDPDAQGSAETMTLQDMKDLPDPEDFVKGGSRKELEKAGEGKKVSVVAYLLTAKVEGGESCNCGLTDTKNKDVAVNTDNHLVLVSRATVDQFPASGGGDVFHEREAESNTAEFTPRVRLSHPNFVRAKIQPLIDDTEEGALRVRVTGLLLFDSEHFLHNHLNRVNNWEIHPILKLEYCPEETGDNCQADSDDGWVSLDDQP